MRKARAWVSVFSPWPLARPDKNFTRHVPAIAQTISAWRCSAISGRGGSRSAMANSMRHRPQRSGRARQPEPGSKSTTAQFLSWFDEFAAGSEALVLRRSERTDTARGIRQLCFFKNAALGDQSFETRQTKSACDRDAQPMRPATTSTTLF